MASRRYFLGSLAAFCVASGSTAFALPPLAPFLQLPLGAPLSDLTWDSIVINTLPHTVAQRPPVVTGVSLQSAGDLIAIVGDDHVVCLYDKRRQTYVEHLKRHTDWVRSAAFSPDGTQLATAGNDRTLLIWNVGEWAAPAIVKRHPEAIIQVVFSNDGNQLATVGFDQWLRIYDCQTGDEIQKIECPCPDMHAVDYSANDGLLAAAGRCGTIRVWDTQAFRQTTEFKAHRQRIRSLEFDGAGKIVSASDDQTVSITDPNSPASARSFPRMAAKLYATAVLDDGLIATAGSDNQIHVWQTSDLKKVGSLRGHTGTVTSLAYAQKQLVSGSYDTHVRVWTTQQQTALEQRTTELSNGWNPTLK